MKPFLALLGVSFKSLMLTTFHFGRSKKKAASGLGAMLIFSLLMLMIAVTYSFSLAALFGPAGGLDIMLMIILLVGFSLSLLFTLLSAQGLIYATKDIDLVLSLPVSAFSVMLARLLALYLEVLLVVEVFCLSSGIVYLLYGGAGGIAFLLLYILGGALLAFIPTLVGLVFGAAISLLVSHLRHKNLFTTLFSILFMLAILAGSALLPRATLEVTADVTSVRAVLSGIFPPISWAVRGATAYSFLSLLLLAAVCILPLLFFTWLFSLFYKPLLTRLSSHHLKSNYRLGHLSAAGPSAALFRKEAGKFFGTPAYVLNCGFSVIMIIALSVLALLYKSSIHEVLLQLQTEGLGELTTYIPLFLFVFLALLQCLLYPAAVSISLEGKTLWILKEAPVSTLRIFAAKAGFNFLLSGLTVLIATPFLGAAFSLPIVQTAAVLVLCLLFAAFSSMMNLLTNLLFPKMDADNDTIVIKQSASALLAMLFSVVGLVLVGVLYLFLQPLSASFIVFCIAAAGFLLLMCASVGALLVTKGQKLFAAL